GNVEAPSVDPPSTVAQATPIPSPLVFPPGYLPPAVTEYVGFWAMFYHCRLCERPGQLALVLIALYLLVIVRERYTTLAGSVKSSVGFESEIVPAVRAGNLEAAIEACRKKARSPLAFVAEPAILEMKYSGKVSPLSLECLRLELERGALTIKPKLGKHIRSLLSISIVTPMIGLASAISCACDLTAYMVPGYRSFSGPDVSEVLSPLGFGVLVGIAAHVAYRLALAKQSEIEFRIQTMTADLLSAYLRNIPGNRSSVLCARQLGFRFMQPEIGRRKKTAW
ncbi:MAG TPA: hypothetical protein VI756_00030, partial [Blastocatellia bacterium]